MGTWLTPNASLDQTNGDFVSVSVMMGPGTTGCCVHRGGLAVFPSIYTDVPQSVPHTLALLRVLRFLARLHGLIKGNLQEHILQIFLTVLKKTEIEVKSRLCNGVSRGLRESH